MISSDAINKSRYQKVDKNNDLGVKAGIRGPVVGRKATLAAALRLGIADPEESDTNAILGALHHHDRLAEGAGASDEIQIAILTGDVRDVDVPNSFLPKFWL